MTSPYDSNPAAKIQSARELAIHQLNRIETDKAFIGLMRQEEGIDPREERQATELIAGITRMKRRLDFMLQKYYKGELTKMEPLLKQILRLGLYELLFLETPPHAALNEAVTLAKLWVRPGAGGLVNGILRSIQRDKEHLPTPKTDDLADDLAIQYSHPTWMVRRWLRQFTPEEVESLLSWNNARPVFGLRINRFKITTADFHKLLDEKGIAWEPSRFLDDFVRVAQMQPVLRAGLVDEGLCAVQDESSGLVVRLLDPQPGETVLDACAAPGGKALYAAQRMGNRGKLLAFDVHEGRLRLVQDAAMHQGVTILQAQAADLRDLAQRSDRPLVDKVLVDAPCSGFGVLAKRADMRWNRSPEEMKELVVLQDQLLDAAAILVCPGGVLVYSTCTIEPDENDARIAAFLQRHPDFQVVPASDLVPPEVVTPQGYLMTLPHRHQIDGAFGVRLQKVAG